MLSLIFLGAYIWVIYNAQYLLREFVKSESKGKIEISTQKVRYSFRRQQFELFNARISSTVLADESTSYVISLKKLVLNTGSLQSVIFRRTFTIDSIDCTQPIIEVIKNKPGESRRISLPDEISKIYKSIGEVISKMNIRHFSIRSGSLALIRKYDPGAEPIRISNIDLTITNLGDFTGDASRDRILYSDRILLESANQDILFPDGFHGLRFSKFRLNTQTRQIEIDSCYIYGKKTKSSAADFGVFVDTLRLLNTDLNALARFDLIRVDSTICMNPEIIFNLEVKNPVANVFAVKKRAKDSLETAFKKLFANLDLHFINVQNAKVDIRLTRGEGSTTYTSRNSNFNLHGLLILEDPATPIQLERFDFAIRNYKGFSRDSAYMIRFDSVLLLKNKLALSNFSIGPSYGNNQADWREVKTRAFELEDIHWAELIYNNKIVADRAILVNPEVEIRSGENKVRKKRQRGSLYRALDGFRDKLEISQLLLTDAKVSISSSDGTLLEMDHFNTSIQANDLLNADDAGELINSISRFSFGSGFLKNKGRQFTLTKGIYNGTEQTLDLGSAMYTGQKPGNKIAAEKIFLKNIRRTASFQYSADSVFWQKADIQVDHHKKTPEENNSGSSFVAKWNYTSGRNTKLNVTGNDLRMNTFLNSITTGPVTVSEDGKPEIEAMSVSGNKLQFSNGGLSLLAGIYFLNDKHISILDQVHLSVAGKKVNVHGYFPRIQLEPDLESILDKKNTFPSLILFQPQLTITDTVTIPDDKKKIKLPVFDIGKLELIEPTILRPDKTTFPSFKISNLKIIAAKSDGEIMKAKNIDLQTGSIKIKNENLELNTNSEKQHLFAIEDFKFQRHSVTGTAQWSARLQQAIIPDFNIGISNDSGISKSILGTGISLQNMQIGTGRPMQWLSILHNNPDLRLQAATIEYKDADDRMLARDLTIDNGGRRISADSFSWFPSISADAFMQLQSVRKNYITVTGGKVRINDFRQQKTGGDSLLHAGSIEMENPELYIYKDMHLPFEAGVIKPLATGMIRRIFFPLVADSVRIRNGLITYEEFNDKTDRIGIVRFSRTDAEFLNFKNADISSSDSLRLTARTRFLDTVQVKLSYRESYTDPGNGFLMSLRISNFGLPALNTILEPLASARIDNGMIDTLHMDVMGNNDVAKGKMQMYYTNLHVSYLNKKDNTKKTVLTRLINFAANNLLLHRKNIKKTGTVYFERIKDKSIFNFWMKIVINGALNNVGVIGGNKTDRRHHREVKKMKIPEIR